MRILGIDWGTARVGVAMSDESQKLAFPLQHPLAAKTAIEEIEKLAAEYEIKKIIIGRPISLKGEATASTVKAEKFAASLGKKIPAEIEFVDERLSSVSSGQALHEQGIKEKDQREVKDNVTAALLLQQYLDGLET